MNFAISPGSDALERFGAQSTRWSAEAESLLEARFWPVLIGLTAVLFAILVASDIHLKLWLDELFTLSVARSPSVGQLAAATLAGADAMPPLYPTIVHFLLPLSPSESLAVRLPSTIGFCAMVVAIAAYARRFLPAAYAIIAGLLAAAMLIMYGSEGRAYGTVLGLAAISLLLWSLAVEGRKREATVPLLAACVAAMTAFHYYAFFFAGCLFLATFVSSKDDRRSQLILAIALIAPAVVVIAAHYPFIQAARVFMAHNFDKPSVAYIPDIYGLLLKWPLILIVAAMLVATLVPGLRETPDRTARTPSASDLIALVLIALAPVGVLAAITLTTHVFTFRYVLWSAIGIAPLTALLLRRLARQSPVVPLALLTILIFGLFGREILHARQWSGLREGGAALAALSSLPDGDEPILVTDAHAFMELTHYAPPALRQRLVYPVCGDLEARYLGYDTDAINLAGLMGRANLNAVPCDQALKPGRDSIVLLSEKGFLPWPLEDGYAIEPLRMDPKGVTIFRVRPDVKYPKP
jgi:hypothetical protein